MAFQSGDIQDLLTRSRNQNWVSWLDGVSLGLMPDSRLENARNARLLPDRRPCSTYWLLVGRARGTMSKMSSHTIGTRHLWLFSPEKKKKNERFSSSHWLTRRDAARGRHGSHFWVMSERQKKRSPPTQPGCPIWGDLKGLLLPFSAIVSQLVSQPYDAFNYGRCPHQTGTSKIRSAEKLLVITMVTAIGHI